MATSPSIPPQALARPSGSHVVFRAVILLALMAPFEAVMRPLVIGEWTKLTNLEILAACVWFAWAISLLVEHRLPRIDRNLALPGLAFVMVCTLSTLLAPGEWPEALRFTGRVTAGFMIFLLVADVVDSRERAITLMKAMALSGVIVAGLGILEYLEASPALAFLSLFKEHPTLVGDSPRVSSSLMYATITSMYQELTFPLLVAWCALLFAQRDRQGLHMAPVLLYLGIVLMLGGTILTFTRTGLIAIAAALIVMAFLWGWRRRVDRVVRVLGVIGASFLVLLVLTTLMSPTFKLRLLSENDTEWYRAVYENRQLPALNAGQTLTAEMVVTNTGHRSWPATGARFFALSYHWLSADGKDMVVFDGLRTPLPREVQPGERVRLQARLRAPSGSGTYRLAWDMVQEHVTWFSAKGARPLESVVEVLPGTAAATKSQERPVAFDPVALPPARLTLWRVAARMFADRPLFGVGPDNFRRLYGRYAGEPVWDTSIHTNNMYIEMFADLGIVGGGVFLWLLASIGWSLLEVFRGTRRETYQLWTLGLAGSLVAFLVHGLLDYFLEFTSIYLVFWMVVALAAVVPRVARGAYENPV